MAAPIAVVGAAGRFPGAEDLNALWSLVRDGRDAFGPIPGDRWDHSSFLSPEQRETDTAWTDRAALLTDVRGFPALDHGLPPRMVEVMDPQQRLLLETARAALQDAGYDRLPLPTERTGVFVGASVSEYRDILVARLRARQMVDGAFGVGAADPMVRDAVAAMVDAVAPSRAYTIPGSLLNMVAATVSARFDLRGPSLTVDAACSSALVALHTAVQSLRSGECDVALVGGVYLALGPDNLVGFTRIGAVSPSGRCLPFTREADGFVLGEGVGLVVLRRLADAERNHVRVRAVVVGSATGNDGRTEGPMTPSTEGQVGVLERAYADAGVEAAAVGYVEAHGTGTTVGDAVEVAALDRVRRGAPGLMGSVKANVGHTMSAAGMAGMLKALLVLEHGTVPPQPGSDSAQADLGGLSLPSRPTALTGDHVAVSSFGFGGTGVHIVLARPVAPGSGRRAPAPARVVISAGDATLVRRYAASLHRAVADDPGIDVDDVATTLAARRTGVAQAAASPRDRRDLLAWLADVAGGKVDMALASGDHADPAPLAPGSRTLPPEPLHEQDYWAVDAGRTHAVATPAAAPPAAAERVSSEDLHVRAAIARVSGFPEASVTADAGLVDDLGFDSLMLVELAEALGLEDDLPPELLQRSTTVGDLEASALFAGTARRPAAPEPVGATEARDNPGRAIGEDLVDLPGMTELEERLGRAADAGLANPYFVLQEPLRAGLTRLDGALRTTFSGYDYLDLARHPDVVEASVRAVRKWGTSASASRVAGGERPPHRDLERALADFLGVDSALTFTSGHATNVTVISTLVGPQDVVVHDALAHDSVVRGALLSGARRVPFRHGEPGDLDRVLAQVRHQHRRALVVIEGVYSMDGDVADLAAISEVSRRHSAMLMVDEAHSLGVLGPTGRGVAEHCGVDRGGADVWMGTLSKSLASCGGYVGGSRRLVEYLRYTAAGFVFSAGMPPASAASARAALGVLAAEPDRVLRLQQKAEHFRTLVRDAGGDVGTSGDSAIVPVIVGDSEGALRLAASLAASGIDVQPIVSPAVDEDQARLRFFVTHGHDDDQLRRAAAALRSVLARTRESAGRP